jgi:ribosome recycling factor
VRACRRDAMDAAKKLQKAGELTEDELRDAEAEIQKLTDKYVASVEKNVEAKEAELLKI